MKEEVIHSQEVSDGGGREDLWDLDVLPSIIFTKAQY